MERPDSSVRLVSADPYWPARFRAESARIRAVLGAATPLEHIGSTAIAGLEAKPFIDMLVGSGAGRDEADCLRSLLALGYVEEGARPEHRWLCWPSPQARAFIVHLVPHGGAVWQARLAFRDRLRASAELREAYTALKREQATVHPDDLSAYTAAKYAFVQAVLAGG